MPNYMNARTDVGAYAITKDKRDIGKFRTAQLRDLKYTAPYMHNGMLATLDDVIDFYDKGGGAGSVLKALNLSASREEGAQVLPAVAVRRPSHGQGPGPARHAGLERPTARTEETT